MRVCLYNSRHKQFEMWAKSERPRSWPLGRNAAPPFAAPSRRRRQLRAPVSTMSTSRPPLFGNRLWRPPLFSFRENNHRVCLFLFRKVARHNIVGRLLRRQTRFFNSAASPSVINLLEPKILKFLDIFY